MAIKDDILDFKKSQNAVLLAHNYQIPDIQDIADFCGDSLELAKISRRLKESTIVFCGVMFMAETVKILSPDKKVLIPDYRAGCPLADEIKEEDVLSLKRKHPNAGVVCYVNSSARIKSLSDVCCTSSNAVGVVKNMPEKEIIFLPDRNLAWWVKFNVPNKEIISWDGYCPVHEEFSPDGLIDLKKKYPQAKVVSHPECPKEILQRSDYVASTSGMIRIAIDDESGSFIVVTEPGMVHRLKKEVPGKEFYPLDSNGICQDMKKITLDKLYNTLLKREYEVFLEKDLIVKAGKALDAMLCYV